MGLIATGWADEPKAAKPIDEPKQSGPSMTMAQRQAHMFEIRTESEKLRDLLQSSASREEKQKALGAFRAKREAWQAEMLSNVVEPTAEKKAASRQRMKESISHLPKERRQMMESRLAMDEEMEKFRAEEKSLSGEERQKRMQQLMKRRRDVMDLQLAAVKAEETRLKTTKRSESPFQQAMEVEREKLESALSANDPEQRRTAIEQFRTAMIKLKEARMQKMQGH